MDTRSEAEIQRDTARREKIAFDREMRELAKRNPKKDPSARRPRPIRILRKDILRLHPWLVRCPDGVERLHMDLSVGTAKLPLYFRGICQSGVTAGAAAPAKLVTKSRQHCRNRFRKGKKHRFPSESWEKLMGWAP
jgi:hypothetical protein